MIQIKSTFKNVHETPLEGYKVHKKIFKQIFRRLQITLKNITPAKEKFKYWGAST